MKILKEVRKEENNYFEGSFWIIADSVDKLLCGYFDIIGQKELTTYEGIRNRDRNVKLLTHKQLWDSYKKNYNNVYYDYYPRGRVSVYNGKAYININSICNTPKVIDSILSFYCIRDLDYEISYNDVNQGSHYDFKLK